MLKQIFLLLIMLSSFCGCHLEDKDRPAVRLEQSAKRDSISTIGIDKGLERGIVAFSSDKGLTWESLNEGLPVNTQAAFLDKKDNELLLATDNQGIFMTEGGKSRWKNIGKGLPASKINALHVAGSEIYVAAYQQGIFKSSDNGSSWQALNQGLPNLSVQAILKVDGSLIVGTDAGIFKREIIPGVWQQTFSSSQILSLNELNGNLIAGTASGVLRSTDKGENWKQIHAERAIHYTSFIDNTIYAMYMSGDVFMSKDLGNTWMKFTYSPSYRAYIYELTKIEDDLIMSNSYGLFKSKDNGKSWSNYLKEERFIFFDFLVVDDMLYGATRIANEYRNRK